MNQDRRRICQAGLALGAVSVLPACGGGSTNMAEMCNTSAVAVGNAMDVPMNGAVMHPTPQANVYICRDADGYYAVDAGCTHLGCDVAPKSATDLKQGFTCPCHGATYDANGLSPTAPAPAPLQHYLLCAQPSGTLLVDLGMVVDPKLRLKL